MSESQFVNQQLPLQLQNEGVATINAIAGAEAIWGEPLIAPDNAYVIHYYVDGSGAGNAVEKFASGYQTFLNAPGMDSLEQGASAIGTFYGEYESPGFNLKETYDQYYTGHDKQQYSQQADAQMHFQHLQDTRQMLLQWNQQLMSGRRHDRAQYDRAFQAYRKANGSGS